MDDTHIRAVLQSLKVNHITVPIFTNEYEETSAMSVYDVVLRSKFDELDDFKAECVKHCGKQRALVEPVVELQVEVEATKFESVTSDDNNNAPIRSLLECLQSVKCPEKYNMSSKVDLMQILLEFKEYIAQTLVKDLDIVKFKLTKKKLKEDLDFIYKNVDTLCTSNTIDNFKDVLRSLVIIASRNMQCTIEVKGDLQLTVMNKSPSNANSHDSKTLLLNCINLCFTLV